MVKRKLVKVDLVQGLGWNGGGDGRWKLASGGKKKMEKDKTK